MPKAPQGGVRDDENEPSKEQQRSEQKHLVRSVAHVRPSQQRQGQCQQTGQPKRWGSEAKPDKHVSCHQVHVGRGACHAQLVEEYFLSNSSFRPPERDK
eukprot:3213935-Prymnesium_polylepis.2